MQVVDKPKKLLFILTIVLSIGSVLDVFSQNVTVEDYKRAEQFLRSNVDEFVYRNQISPHWAEEVPFFWYQVDTRLGSEFFLVDVEKKSKQHFFDHKKLANNLSKVLNKQIDPYDLPLQRLRWDNKENVIRFRTEEQKWIADLESLDIHADGAVQETSGGTRPRQYSKSSDGKWTVFRRNYNLWLRNNDDGKEYQLTDDGAEDKYIYGASQPWNWKKQEGPVEKKREPLPLLVSWSKDSKKLFAHKLDLCQAKLMYLLQYVPENGIRAKSFSAYRTHPGEGGAAQQIPYVFDIESKTKIRLRIGPYDDLVAGTWNWYGKSSKKLYMIIRERGNGSATLLRADAETGVVDTVFSEVSDTFVDPSKMGIEYLPNTDELIWLSERDGWNHIYLYDLNTGEVKNQITKGDYVVYDLEYVDHENRKILFTAGGREPNRDPYLEHLYSINFDGSDLKLLTPENADHDVGFSDDAEYFVDTYSRVDKKPITVLRKSSDGSLVMELEESDIKDLLDIGWQYPEPFKLKARDGKTDIYGVLYRPTNFDPSKKYPIIDATYSGPHAVRTPKSFNEGYRGNEQPIAELGFLIVTVDGLGTSGRSKAFQDYSWKKLGDTGSLDHIKAIKELANRYPYIDTSKVGIYGHSAGGYDAARAIMKHPDFYKVSVSSAGNHDHRVAKAFWPERYMDYPAGPHYEEQSNINIAENLKGHLLLAHGDMDYNVHLSQTMLLADALIEAGKDFDMFIMPNQGHGMSGSEYFAVKRWNYFVEHLLGTKPVFHYKTGE